MSDEASREFRRRLSQWVASQGLWFQIRYSVSDAGWLGKIFLYGARLGLVVGPMLVVASLFFWIYLYERVASDAYALKLEESIQKRLVASEVSLRNARYADDHLQVALIALLGGESTFFESLLIHNMSCDMGLTQTFTGNWNDGVLRIGKMDLHVRPGANDDVAAMAVSGLIFGNENTPFPSVIQIAEANIQWGYSKSTLGGIYGSRLKAHRQDAAWRLSFSGGRFSQNWLRELEIVELVVRCEPSGIVFEKARFSKNGGEVSFIDFELEAGSQPMVSGKLKMSSISLNAILPRCVLGYLEGSISGEFEISGSTNNSRGIAYSGSVRLGEADRISLSDEIPLLAALSVMDYSRTFNHVELTQGGFDVEISEGGLVFSNIDISSVPHSDQRDFQLSLQGEIFASRPSSKQIKQAAEDGVVDSAYLSLVLDGQQDIDIFANAIKFEGLAKLAQSKASQFMISEDKDNLFNRLNIQRELSRIRLSLSDQLTPLMNYEGNCVITIPGNAFERAQDLLEVYPVETSSGRIRMEVPISGMIEDLTKAQSEDMYRRGRR